MGGEVERGGESAKASWEEATQLDASSLTGFSQSDHWPRRRGASEGLTATMSFLSAPPQSLWSVCSGVFIAFATSNLIQCISPNAAYFVLCLNCIKTNKKQHSLMSSSSPSNVWLWKTQKKSPEARVKRPGCCPVSGGPDQSIMNPLITEPHENIMLFFFFFANYHIWVEFTNVKWFLNSV